MPLALMSPPYLQPSPGSTLLQPFSKDQECVQKLSGKAPGSDELTKDLSVNELNDIYAFLPIAGSLDNYSPLHHQLILNREIKATNQARLHMLWMRRVIYFKPLPSYLMNAAYVRDYVCHDRKLYPLVMGFLLSYCKILKSPLDISVAHDSYLLPEDITWDKWELFRNEIISTFEGRDDMLNMRYDYGELRIARLNMIYRLTGRGVVYFTTHREYGTYFSEYFQLFITIFAFASTILQAMQVALSGDQYPTSVDKAAYVISLITIFGVAVSILLVGILFFWMFLANAYLTARAQHRA